MNGVWRKIPKLPLSPSKRKPVLPTLFPASIVPNSVKPPVDLLLSSCHKRLS